MKDGVIDDWAALLDALEVVTLSGFSDDLVFEF